MPAQIAMRKSLLIVLADVWEKLAGLWIRVVVKIRGCGGLGIICCLAWIVIVLV